MWLIDWWKKKKEKARRKKATEEAWLRAKAQTWYRNVTGRELVYDIPEDLDSKK